jgi:hypothetical protein
MPTLPQTATAKTFRSNQSKGVYRQTRKDPKRCQDWFKLFQTGLAVVATKTIDGW